MDWLQDDDKQSLLLSFSTVSTHTVLYFLPTRPRPRPAPPSRLISSFPSPPYHHHHFSPFNNDHGLFIDWLLLPVCGTKRMKLDLHRGGFEINWAADRS